MICLISINMKFVNAQQAEAVCQMLHCIICAIRAMQTEAVATPTMMDASLSLSDGVHVGLNTDRFPICRLAVRVAADVSRSELNWYWAFFLQWLDSPLGA
jgi:hypothetical protein